GEHSASHRQVGKRVELVEHLQRSGTQSADGDDVAGERVFQEGTGLGRIRTRRGQVINLTLQYRAAERIRSDLWSQKGREIPGAGRGRRHAGEASAGLARAESFPVGKEPRIVLPAAELR